LLALLTVRSLVPPSNYKAIIERKLLKTAVKKRFEKSPNTPLPKPKMKDKKQQHK